MTLKTYDWLACYCYVYLLMKYDPRLINDQDHAYANLILAERIMVAMHQSSSWPLFSPSSFLRSVSMSENRNCTDPKVDSLSCICKLWQSLSRFRFMHNNRETFLKSYVWSLIRRNMYFYTKLKYELSVIYIMLKQIQF